MDLLGIERVNKGLFLPWRGEAPQVGGDARPVRLLLERLHAGGVGEDHALHVPHHYPVLGSVLKLIGRMVTSCLCVRVCMCVTGDAFNLRVGKVDGVMMTRCWLYN